MKKFRGIISLIILFLFSLCSSYYFIAYHEKTPLNKLDYNKVFDTNGNPFLDELDPKLDVKITTQNLQPRDDILTYFLNLDKSIFQYQVCVNLKTYYKDANLHSNENKTTIQLLPREETGGLSKELTSKCRPLIDEDKEINIHYFDEVKIPKDIIEKYGKKQNNTNYRINPSIVMQGEVNGYIEIGLSRRNWIILSTIWFIFLVTTINSFIEFEQKIRKFFS